MARRSANSQRRLNRQQGGMSLRRPLSNTGDWIVSGAGCNAAGAVTVSAGWGQNWNLTQGVPIHQLLVALPVAAAATGQPTIGTVEVAAVQGKVSFEGTSATTAAAAVVCAMYIVELNSTATTWSVRDPSTPSDANRDDYLFLDTMGFQAVLSTSAVAQTELCFRLGLPFPVRIGGGQALILTVAQQVPIPASTTPVLNGSWFVRSLVRKAA